ncbi:MAG: CHAT domain-containing protein [Planctomycetes bacterium]|nr:CHAT domain-containing protein [Planctomycetota bacterium]
MPRGAEGTTAQPASQEANTSALPSQPPDRALCDAEYRKLRSDGKLAEALERLQRYDQEIQPWKLVHDRHLLRVNVVQLHTRLGQLEEARRACDTGIEDITRAHDAALARKAEIEAGAAGPLEEHHSRTLADWNSGALVKLRGYYHVQYAGVLQALGLSDGAIRELELAQADYAQATASKADCRDVLPALWRLESNVRSNRFDPKGYADFYERLAARNPTPSKDEARILAVIRAHLGATLNEYARLEPQVWTDSARGHLEGALASGILTGGERVEPNLALCDLDLRAGKLADARERLNRADKDLGDEPGRSNHPQYATFKTLEARFARTNSDDAGKAELLTRRRDELVETLGSAVEKFKVLDLWRGGHGILSNGDMRGLLGELIELERLLAPGAAGVERAFEHLLSIEKASTLVRKLGASPADLARVRGTLLAGRSDHAVLHYLFGPVRSYVFYVDSKSVECFPLASRDELESLLLEVEAELSIPPAAAQSKGPARALKSTQAFSERMLPAELCTKLLRCDRVTIIGREMLGNVPFEALLLGSGPRLGLHLAVADVPSASVGALLVERARTLGSASPSGGARSAALVGMPKGPRWSLASSSAEAMLAPFDAKARHVALGERATRSALDEGARFARLLVVLTHGKQNWERVDPATLLLQGETPSETVWIGASELSTFSSPELVVLLACGADVEPARRGDAGSAGLAGTLLSGGARARCVILGSFDLDSGAATTLGRLLNEALVGGADPASALRQARKTMAARPEFADPFYWGLLRAVGAGHETLFSK